jgi:hypothetical protein
MIKTWSATIHPLEYEKLLQQWLIFNDIRTAAAVISFLCLVIVTIGYREQHQTLFAASTASPAPAGA